MLWTIAIILLILWLLGFSFHFGGTLIHIILVIVVIVVIIRLVTGPRGVGVQLRVETPRQSLPNKTLELRIARITGGADQPTSEGNVRGTLTLGSGIGVSNTFHSRKS